MTITTRADYDEAIAKITSASVAYYDSDAIEMSDADYDALCQEVARAESEHPDWGDTQGAVASGAPLAGDVMHASPMLSLDNVFDAESLAAWAARLDVSADTTLVVEPKFDGMAISALYRDGNLVRIATRGDGTTGEDVTFAADSICFLPAHIEHGADIEVRGEVMLTTSQFEAANTVRVEHNKKPFVNPRNGVAGALRGARDRDYAIEMTFMLYDVIGSDGGTYSGVIASAREMGIGSPDVTSYARTISDISGAVEDIAAARNDLAYDIDGAVVKVDDLALRERIGFRSRSPKWAIAYKYPAQEQTSVLREVLWQVGRTGVITPRLRMDPVQVGGTTVSYATGHNAGDLARKDIRLGDTILVIRAGDVVPRVEGSLPALRDGSETPIAAPTTCPRCGSDVEQDGARVRCSRGRMCGLTESLAYAVSKSCLDIDGLGKVQVRNLVESGTLTSIEGLFALTEDDLVTGGKVAPANAVKILGEIETAREADNHRVIAALGIEGTGRRMSMTLAQHFGTLSALAAAGLDEIMSVPGVGDGKGEDIVTGLADRRATIEALVSMGIGESTPETPDEDAAPGALDGMTVVVTGTMTGAYEGKSRDEMNDLITASGGHASSSVSKKTDLVVCGASAGSKKSKAESLGVRIVDCDGLAAMLV